MVIPLLEVTQIPQVPTDSLAQIGGTAGLITGLTQVAKRAMGIKGNGALAVSLLVSVLVTVAMLGLTLSIQGVATALVAAFANFLQASGLYKLATGTKDLLDDDGGEPRFGWRRGGND